MVSALSIASIGFGTALAQLAARFPARTELFETIGGILLIGGLAAIGCALPSI